MKSMETPVHIPEIPWHIHRYDTVDSTQNLALSEARDLVSIDRDLPPCSHFSVHIAHRQTHGRGQHARAWESPAGGLYLSAVIAGAPAMEPNFAPLAAGVAVTRTIEQLLGTPDHPTQAVTVRWPNDILLYGKKVAGILTEGIFQGDQRAIVIGIGLNLNTDTSQFPLELQPYANSISAQTGNQWNPDMILNSLLGHLQNLWRPLAGQRQAGHRARILHDLTQRDALRNRLVSVAVENRTVSGKGAGFAANGALMLQTATGTESISSGTVITLNEQPVRAGMQP